MPVESTVTGIWDIDTNYPDGTTETVSLLDNYMRARWEKLLVTFPNIGGVVTASHTELNYVDGVTSAIQTQLDAKLVASTYTAADVLAKVKTVDGTGSGLDADLLDGEEGSAYAKLASADFTALQVGGVDVATAADLVVYDSGEIAVPSVGSEWQQAHGLGERPKWWTVVLRCTTAEHGYAVGDEIDLTYEVWSTIGTSISWANATNVEGIFTMNYPILSRATLNVVAINTANWRMVVRAWA